MALSWKHANSRFKHAHFFHPTTYSLFGFGDSQMDTEAKYTELYETMKALLSNPHPDYDEVKMTAGGFLSIHKSFPSDLRFKIWEVLLDVSERVWFWLLLNV